MGRDTRLWKDSLGKAHLGTKEWAGENKEDLGSSVEVNIMDEKDNQEGTCNKLIDLDVVVSSQDWDNWDYITNALLKMTWLST